MSDNTNEEISERVLFWRDAFHTVPVVFAWNPLDIEPIMLHLTIAAIWLQEKVKGWQWLHDAPFVIGSIQSFRQKPHATTDCLFFKSLLSFSGSLRISSNLKNQRKYARRSEEIWKYRRNDWPSRRVFHAITKRELSPLYIWQLLSNDL